MKNTFTLLFLLCLLKLSAQDFYDLNTIQTIEITFEQSNWDALMDAEKAGDENYILAKEIAINGVVFDSVGVKYKGNSTYNPNQTKNPFHIELDTYKDHIYDGYTDIKLSNVAKDPSFVREVLSYKILRKYMDAPLSNYANVYINGTLIGLFSNSESISKKFVNKRFYSKNNTRVKCNPPDGAGPQSSDFPNLVYLGEDSSDYYDAYEMKSDAGWDELIDLCDTLSNHTDQIEKILDVDRALWMLAFNNMLVNLDSYTGGFSQNYYLYRDDYGRFLPIVWDLNESFGRFSMTGTINLNNNTAKQQMTPLLHENDADFPLIQKLMAVPTYKRMYLAHCKTMLLENFDNNSYFIDGDSMQTLIDASVLADENKFFTYQNFLDNLTTDAGGGGGPGGGTTIGITNLMDARNTYLLGLTEFTQTAPTISNITVSNTSPLVNETITITTDATDEDMLLLNYRSLLGGPFTSVEMFDDGSHGDGGANDGVYGIDIIVENDFVEYYFYAENGNAGIFSPVRAAHEYYTINAITIVDTTVGDVVINEFMASNDMTAADQDGEFDDWIELYNNTGEAISLEGYFMSDDGDDLTQWQFPTGTSIDANDYLIIWADDDTDQAGLHANFKLSAGGESIYLLDADSNIVDEITYTDQTTDRSHGRFPNGTGGFIDMAPTFNAENSQLVINEFMASNDMTAADQDGEFDDWIELYNNTNEAIDLGGYFMSDDGGDLTQWQIPVGTSIDANGYLIIWADDDGDQAGLHANFKLSAGGESIYLLNADSNIVDEITYIDQTTDISHGRFPNGTGSFIDMTPTFNAENDPMSSTQTIEMEALGFLVFPNPTSESFYIELAEDTNEKDVMIIGVNGNVQYQSTISSRTWVNTSDWPSGMYVVRVDNNFIKLIIR